VELARTVRLLEHERGCARLQRHGDGGHHVGGHVGGGGGELQQRAHAGEGAHERKRHGAVAGLGHLRAQEAITRQVGLAEVELHLPCRVAARASARCCRGNDPLSGFRRRMGVRALQRAVRSARWRDTRARALPGVWACGRRKRVVACRGCEQRMDHAVGWGATHLLHHTLLRLLRHRRYGGGGDGHSERWMECAA
jgi:hypothetical protein